MKKIFSVTNTYDKNIKHKVITVLGIKIKFKSFFEPLKEIIREEISYACAREIYSALEVSKQHSMVFSKYRNYHQNKNLAIVGCGPTVKYFDNQIKADYNIALNDAIFLDKFNFDYLFNWDTGVLINKPNWYEDVNKFSCAKFYGHCVADNVGSPKDENSDEQNNISHFYYSARHGWPAFDYGEVIHKDLTTYPLMDFGSISFGALSFALYTKPKKLYLIGLDTSNIGHAFGKEFECCYPLQRMMRGYKKFKEFIDIYYPDVEVISVNPVGLKGLFRDVYTQNFVDAHPELKKENIEIITVENLET